MKTIKQIADEIGVTKQAVHQKRKSKELSIALQPFTSIVDDVVYISVDGEKLIKSAFLGNDRKHVYANESSIIDGLVDTLNSELQTKNKQITVLQDEVALLQKELASERQHSRFLAERAQQLHAGTMQKQLSDSQSEIILEEKLIQTKMEIKAEIREEFKQQQEQIAAENEKLISYLQKTRDSEEIKKKSFWSFFKKDKG